jgi:hypothetical protein
MKTLLALLMQIAVLTIGCTYQMVRFETVPEKADVSVNGIPLGAAPVTAKLVTDGFATDFSYRRHIIVARKDCYEDEQLILQSPSIFFSDTRPFPSTIAIRLRRDPRCSREGFMTERSLPPAVDKKADRLLELSDLRARGLITASEYSKQRAKLLDEP